MSHSVRLGVAAAAASLVLVPALVRPPAASAGSPLDAACGLIGTIGEGWLGSACKAVVHPGKLVGVVKGIVGGKPGQAVKVLLGGAGKNVLSARGALGIAAIVAWAVGGAHFVLSETAKLVGSSTSPELITSWFSSMYWRVAGVAALLTLPFLFAAAIQAILRSDGALLARAVFAYLPLSFLATGIAAPIAMMLLSVGDWMGSSVASAAGDQGSHFLIGAGTAIGALGVAVGSPFVTFLIALLTAAGGLILWLELLVREAAVYVVVLMLPLVFAAMVWPARRVWAVRSVEVLVALILAKFAIVAVLALAAAALGHGGGSLIVRSLAGLVLVALGAFAPWVLLRLLPLAEVASAAAGHVREHAQARFTSDAAVGKHGVSAVTEGVSSLLARMNNFDVDAGHVASSPTRGRLADDVTRVGEIGPLVEAATGARSASAAAGSPAPASTPEPQRPQPGPPPSPDAAPSDSPTRVSPDRREPSPGDPPARDEFRTAPEIEAPAADVELPPTLPAESDQDDRSE